MKEFAFNLGHTVKLLNSDEEGVIIGRAEYATSEDCYYIRYKRGDGCMTKDWWNESDIKDAS